MNKLTTLGCVAALALAGGASTAQACPDGAGYGYGYGYAPVAYGYNYAPVEYYGPDGYFYYTPNYEDVGLGYGPTYGYGYGPGLGIGVSLYGGGFDGARYRGYRGYGYSAARVGGRVGVGNVNRGVVRAGTGFRGGMGGGGRGGRGR